MGYSKDKKTADREFAEDYIRSTSDRTTSERIRNGESFTDDEGNYWGFTYNREGKRVRVCIPAR